MLLGESTPSFFSLLEENPSLKFYIGDVAYHYNTKSFSPKLSKVYNWWFLFTTRFSFNRVDNTIESFNFSISHKITFIGFRKCLNIIRIRKYTLGQDFKGLIAQI